MIEQFDPSKIPVDLILKPNALMHFKKLLEQEDEKDKKDKKVVRFDVTKTGCSGYSYECHLVSLSELNPSDLEIKSIKEISVWMSEKAKPLINGVVVDYQKMTLGQSKLIYENPNETARCGCGVSFSVDKSPDTVSDQDQKGAGRSS